VPQQVTNLTSNITAELAKPSFSSERLAQRVEDDLRALEQSEFDRLAQERRERGEEITIPELDPSKWNKELYMDKAAEPVRVEGATTVWHDLQGRIRADDVPGYLCRSQGRVAVRITVAQDGSVLKADLDPARSTQADECMLENALRSAKRARFNASPNGSAAQNGTVFFLFLPQ
jgi:TonB family protein